MREAATEGPVLFYFFIHPNQAMSIGPSLCSRLECERSGNGMLVQLADLQSSIYFFLSFFFLIHTFIEPYFIQMMYSFYDFRYWFSYSVDEKVMIRNRYNRIPHPAPDT